LIHSAVMMYLVLYKHYVGDSS